LKEAEVERSQVLGDDANVVPGGVRSIVTAPVTVDSRTGPDLSDVSLIEVALSANTKLPSVAVGPETVTV
jgi:hypothetical protein